MSAIKKNQARLDAFFSRVQPSSTRAIASSQPPDQPPRATSQASANVPHPAVTTAMVVINSRESTSEMRGQTSSFSSLPGRDPPARPVTPPKPSAPTGRVVRSSDDEESDSDSSLEDLTTLLQSNRSASRPRPTTNGFTPSTPSTPRMQSMNFPTSPLTVQPKYKTDLRSLASHAEADAKTEASSKRVKAMLAASEANEGNLRLPRGADHDTKFKHNELLQSVVAENEGGVGDMHKVARAMMRTEATLSEQRWYFFDQQIKIPKPEERLFPINSSLQNWQDDLRDPQLRYQAFVSGFAEDMAHMGKALPDEIFLWMLNEICLESNEPLRVSYCNVLNESSEQVRRLLTHTIILKMFKNLGASSTGIAVAQRITLTNALPEPYRKRDWTKLCSVVKFFGQSAEWLGSKSQVVCILLRMCVDRVVLENVDIFDLVQETVNRLCSCGPDDSWETSCQEICTSLFNCVDQSTLRLQIVEGTPSTSPRTHDLRRRLAMSFYFNDLSYSTKHSHSAISIDKFIDRLEDSDFNATPQTDYRELAALILLLDIAVDDGRSADVDLTDRQTEKRFDESIEEFGAAIKDIMRSIGNPGAAFISRIEAKEVMELVSQRIADTLRSKPRPKITVFDTKDEEDLEGEKNGMAAWISKMGAGVGQTSG